MAVLGQNQLTQKQIKIGAQNFLFFLLPIGLIRKKNLLPT